MSFDAIVGQDRAIGALRRILRAGRVGHAYLFAGPHGVGKMTAARAFVQALLCRQQTDDACGDCEPCAKVARGTHPDVHRVEPAGAGRQIVLPVFRHPDTGDGLLKDLRLRPNEAPRNVALIDDAHAMNASAANGLLKTLEEPPPASLLILVTPRPDALPETILSRCHLVRFAALPVGIIRDRLEAAGVDRATAQFLAASAGGSLGRALHMAGGKDLPELRRETLRLLATLTPANTFQSAARFLQGIGKLAEARLEADPATTARAAARSTAEWLFDLAVLFYRDVALRQLGVDDARLFNVDVLDLVAAETPIRRGDIQAILDTIETAKNRLRSNVDTEAVVLDVFSRIASCRAHRSADTIGEPRRGR